MLNEKIGIIKLWKDLAQSSAAEKFKILSIDSSLAATLLVIATFNERLITITNYVKILLAILLALIPVSLWGLLYILYKDEKIARENLEAETGSKMKYGGIMHILRDIFPYIITGILTVIMFLMIALILS